MIIIIISIIAIITPPSHNPQDCLWLLILLFPRRLPVGLLMLNIIASVQAIAHTMHSSYKELSLLLLFVGMGMLIFGRWFHLLMLARICILAGGWGSS